MSAAEYNEERKINIDQYIWEDCNTRNKLLKRRKAMIYYFSGTGNSKWAAERLAELLGDQAKDIMKERVPQAQREQVIGLVFPIYAWGV